MRRYDHGILEPDLPEVDLDSLRTILIDEKAVRKGHNYVTTVINAETGEMLYMAEGKKSESIETFFETLTVEQRAKIESMDHSAVQRYLPDADIVYDRFHLMLNINAAVDEVRRAEWRKRLNSHRCACLLYSEEGIDGGLTFARPTSSRERRRSRACQGASAQAMRAVPD